MRFAMVIGTAAALMTCSLVFAGEPIAGAEWAPVTAGPITTWAAPLVGKGKLAVQPFFIYSHTRGSFDDGGHYDALPGGESKSQLLQQLFALYGITDKWEIDARISYQQNFAAAGGAEESAQGFGDSFIFTRYSVIEDKGGMPQVTGVLQVKVPTGKYQHLDGDKNDADLMGTGSWDPGVGVALSKKIEPFILRADFTANFPQRVRVDGSKTEYAYYLNYDAAVEYVLPKGFNLMVELNALTQGDQKVNGSRVPASDVASLIFAPGIGWSNDRIQTLITYQRTVWGVNAAANDAVVATFVYTF